MAQALLISTLLTIAGLIATIVMYARAYWIDIRAMNENATLMERYLREE